MSSHDGTSPPESKSVEEIVREYAPPGEFWPALPGFHSDSGWEFRTVSRRTCPGRDGETQLCPATGEDIPLAEPHIHVTARRDEFPHVPGPTAEFKHFVFPSRTELRQWFEEDREQ
jgi:hypothetical protein